MPFKISNPPKHFKNKHDPPQGPMKIFSLSSPRAFFISYTLTEERQCIAELFLRNNLWGRDDSKRVYIPQNRAMITRGLVRRWRKKTVILNFISNK